LFSRRLLQSAAVGIAALGTYSCNKTGIVKKVHADTIERTIVPVVRVRRGDLAKNLELAAEFRPYLNVEVHAKVAGYLRQIYVDVGDHVKAGQLLAVLEVPELNDDLAQAEAAIERNKAEVVRAQEDLRRAESAYEATHANYTRLASVTKKRPDLVAQQELDDAQAKDREGEAQISASKAALEAAKHEVQVAEANQSRLRTLLAYSRITAPFTGVVTKRYADPGAMIQTGINSESQAMPLVDLAQADRLRLTLAVPESMAARIHLGSPVAVRVPALDRTFEGRVSRFSGNVDTTTRTMHTEIDIPNPTLELMPGMYAYATLTLDHKSDALTVPIEAVAQQDGRASVLVVNSNNTIEERPVRLGIETPERVEVVSGLHENDLVVTGSRARFRPGETVEARIQPEQNKTVEE
jgi:RND family efflux transporter MFP subunit